MMKRKFYQFANYLTFQNRRRLNRHFSLESKLYYNSVNTTRVGSQMLPVSLKQRNGGVMNMNFSIWEPTYKTPPGKTSPVIIALHGVPGSWDDFKEVGEELAKKGARFIVPEFPGFGGSIVSREELYKFDHSTEGKFEMLKAIVQELGLTRIDVCLGHSAGTWLAYKTCADMEMVKSGVFLNALGLRPHRTCRPYWFTRSFAWSLRNKVTHPVVYKLLPVVYKIVGFTVTDPRPLQAAVETVATCGFENMGRYADSITRKQLPLLFAWAEKDKIVEKEISTEMAKRTGVCESEIIHIDKENNKMGTIQFEQTGLFRRALSFERGGHLIQKAHLHEIVDNIEQLIKFIQK